MNTKMIIGGAGLFGLGAILGWAIGSDIQQNRDNVLLEASERLLRKTEDKVYALENPGQIVRPYSQDDVKATQFMHEHRLHSLKDLSPEMLKPINSEEIGTGASAVFLSDDENSSSISETSENIVEDLASEGDLPEHSGSDDDVEMTEYEAAKSNLQSIINRYTKNESSTDSFIDQTVRTMEHNRVDPPFVISQDKFAWDPEEGDDFEKITLKYYPRDRVLLDDGEDVLEDVPGVVGWKNLDQFGFESNDPDVVFVRNRRMASDFEIIRSEEDLPLHVKYGMSKDVFETNKAAGIIKFRTED